MFFREKRCQIRRNQQGAPIMFTKIWTAYLSLEDRIFAWLAE